MDKAPADARKVALELQEAAPGLENFQLCRSSEGDSPGEVIVISGATDEPKKACLKARKETDFGMDLL